MSWKESAKTALTRPANKRTPLEQKCVEFVNRLDKVDQEWLRRCETVMALAMTPGQSLEAWRNASDTDRDRAVKTAMWKASHQAPEDYSTQTRTELTGAEGGPVEVSVSAADVFQALKDAKAAEGEA